MQFFEEFRSWNIHTETYTHTPLMQPWNNDYHSKMENLTSWHPCYIFGVKLFPKIPASYIYALQKLKQTLWWWRGCGQWGCVWGWSVAGRVQAVWRGAGRGTEVPGSGTVTPWLNVMQKLLYPCDMNKLSFLQMSWVLYQPQISGIFMKYYIIGRRTHFFEKDDKM